MRARIIVFPIKGRNWCYSRSIESATAESHSNHTPSTLKDLWTKLNSSSSADAKSAAANAELIIDFASNKMNQSWTSLEKAPPGSFKNKLYGLGLRLLARVKPSEMFLKSISKDVKEVEVAFPSSLNARLVRRRLRHIALRGTVIHKKYFYGSAALLPLTTVFTVLPLPNIPFFWILFRTYSHWRALQGSERLLQLVSDDSKKPNSSTLEDKKTEDAQKNDSENDSTGHLWVLRPSKELENVIQHADTCEGLSNCTISDICKTYNLHTVDVLKYRDLV